MEQKKLYRNQDEGKVAGVCAGLAEYFNVDVTIIRVLFVILSLAGGPGVLLYIILWVIMPETPKFSDYIKNKNDDY